MDNSFGCGQCYSVRYSPDGSVLLAGYENGQIDIMSSSSRQVNRIRGAHSDGINCFCWINSNRFLSCSDDHNLLSWDVRMPERPMQVVNVINMTPDPFHYSCYNWLKDIHFVPKSLGKPGMIYVTAFANWIYRLRLGNDDVMKPVAPVQLPVDAVRSAMLPIDGLFGENLIVSSEINHGHLESYFLPYFPASVELPDYVRPNENCCKSVSVDPGSRHGSYRGLKPDPGGGGLLAKKTMYCKLRGVYSAVTYYRLESKEKDATIPSKMIRTLFMRDKCSEEILQEPAFAPNGCFVANPQDRRVDILTNGRSAVPFRHFGNRPEQFHVATTLRMASCSDILCCDISPRDSVTVASGCTMGHVHLAQPVL